MKYMLLIYSAEDAWTDEERQACFEESIRLTRKLDEAGQFVAASPLESVSTAASVRIREGKPMVTNGPFAETHEQLGGYFLIEAENLDQAVGIASRIPTARKGTVEVRPVFELDGLPEPS
ncbi:MAG: YciI family protein [Maioricimonas sp. JB049]